MKKSIILFFLISLGRLSASAQEAIPLQSCNNEQVIRQADSVKAAMTAQGFIVLREASVSMESEYEQPVIVPMQAGGLYYFAFVGDMASNLFEVRMYDWEEREVVYRKFKRDFDGNLISFDYVPKGTEYHMIKPLQVSKQKKKGLCGYVILFKKVK